MLRPQYTRRPFELMLIGPPDSGKRTIAKQLLKTNDVFYSLNVAEVLPNRDIERVDYVLIVVDMTKISSLTLLDEILKRIKSNYLLDKVAILITKVENPNLWEFEKEDIEQLVELYFDLHLFYVNLNSQVEIKRMIDQISRLIKISTLQYKNLNTSILKTLDTYTINDQ